jgi:hypothetical protein
MNENQTQGNGKDNSFSFSDPRLQQIRSKGALGRRVEKALEAELRAQKVEDLEEALEGLKEQGYEIHLHKVESPEAVDLRAAKARVGELEQKLHKDSGRHLIIGTLVSLASYGVGVFLGHQTGKAAQREASRPLWAKLVRKVVEAAF